MFLVTSAQPGHSQEMSGRMRRYLISMTIRVICLILAIFVLHGWMRLLGVGAALVLPWFAVVMANAGPVHMEEEPNFVTLDRIQIGPSHDDAPTDAAAPETSAHPDSESGASAASGQSHRHPV